MLHAVEITFYFCIPGSTPSKTLRMFKGARIKIFSRQTYGNIQAKFLIPAVYDVWNKEKQLALEASSRELSVAGDAR